MTGRARMLDLPERFSIAERFLVDRLAEGAGDRTALLLDGGARTYAEVDALANRYANALVAHGVRPEERVLIALPDGEDFVGALFGTFKAGAVAVMLNPAQQPDAYAAILRYARARTAVVADDLAACFVEAAVLAGAPLRVLAVGAAAPAEDRLVATAARGDATADPLDPPSAGRASRRLAADVVPLDPTDHDDAFDVVPCHPDDAVLWLFSGGTTGTPKAVVQTHRSYATTTERYAVETLGWCRDDVTISVPKLYFGYATGCNLFFPFRVGGASVLFADPPSPQGLFDRIARHRATILVNVPSMAAAMLDAAETSGAGVDLSSLRFATSAGEALPPTLHHRWRERFGVELLDGLGTAEQWHVFVTNRPGDVRPGTLGRPVDGFAVEARAADGHPVPAGEVGALWVSGGSRAQGYWRNAETTQEVFRGEWVVTGDLVRIDEEGYVTYVGRGDDALKVKGRWFVPAEVEGCLLEHPAVTAAAVIGAPDADGLLKPVAFVTVDTTAAAHADPPDEDALRTWVLDRLDAYKHPRRVVLLDALPATHLGKVDRSALRRLAATPEEHRA